MSAAPKSLDGAHVFLTGGTGFVGQAVLERLLSAFPDTRVSLLVRPKGSTPGEARLANLLRKPVFSRWKETVGEDEAARIAADRVTVVEGTLSDLPTLPGDIDVVIHSASTVSFDPPIDAAFETNVSGATGLYTALAASGADPHVAHVSTAYVGGTRKGVAPEASLTHDVDWRAEAAAADSARKRVELASRQPEVLRRIMARARAKHGKAGPQAVAQAAEAARVEWVTERLVDYGRARAESLGWTDVYTLTKAFAERAAEELWAQTGHRLSIVRPSIIESALRHPYPGWIDGFKVADPLILAYGRGLLPEFPGLPDSVLDIIPVDFVVNAILAVAATDPEPGHPQYFHVTSGAANPLPVHTMHENVREFFTEHPVPEAGGLIEVPVWRFPGGRTVERSIVRRERALAAADWAVRHLPASSRTRAWDGGLQRRKGKLDALREYSGLYHAYVQTEIVFDDSNTYALHSALPDDVRDDRGFDVHDIDWADYLQNVHFPAVTTRARTFAPRRPATKKAKKPLPQRTDVVAVFDLEGTVVRSNLVEQYLWLRLGTLPKTVWPKEFADLLVWLPKYLQAERRDRGEFIRTFTRRYEGFAVADVERLVRGRFGTALYKRVMPQALEQVRRHREAGHRTVLVTGAIDLMVAPLADLFDEVVAGRMHERDGILTGYLATPPLVDEARAAWLRQYARKNGIDLTGSYGYGDSHADLVWLELLGHPNAVNPDAELYRYARQRKWDVHDWDLAGRPEAATAHTGRSLEKGEG